MEMKGEKIIFTSREKVWEALNDPEQLLKAIPGAQSVEKIDDENLIATVKTKIGPISAKFSGKIKLSDINPPHSYKLTGEGTGGAAGFAKGQAEVELNDHEDGTKLSYSVNASVGGKLAQIGQRLIDTAANKLADEFFGKFNEILSEKKDTISSEEKNQISSPGIIPSKWISSIIILVILSIVLWYFLGQMSTALPNLEVQKKPPITMFFDPFPPI